MDKIKEAQDILKNIGLPEAQQNKISALTLLALSNLKPEDDWSQAISKSMTLSKDIIEFVNDYYAVDYKPNTRESFRKIALKPFVENNIVDLNPDNKFLKPTSSKTHYALTPAFLDVVKNYGSSNWNEYLNTFKKNQFPENKRSGILLREIKISNYKSISEDKIELGRFNVFIGANGCGKTNILEAIATLGATLADDLNFEGLYSRGVRIARPDLTISSFLSIPKKENINIKYKFQVGEKVEEYNSSFYPEDPNDVYTKWRNSDDSDAVFGRFQLTEVIKEVLSEMKDLDLDIDNRDEDLLSAIRLRIKNYSIIKGEYKDFLSDYAIFDLNTKSLRGVIPADSRKTPLGINGEGLDLLIANMNAYEKEYLKECTALFDWLESIYSDKDDRAKIEGLKPGRSSSTLYFKDRFMQKQNNTFSAENSNEGILHILFYMALFISNRTPNLFAIDNIETALNPRLCQKLVKMLVKLSEDRGKQALITTHNPAVLDGLNLLDDEQRLFEVYRDSAGNTRIRRIKFKKDLSDKSFKLSEMWLKGLLGAVPKNF